jgi:hypothetical protein
LNKKKKIIAWACDYSEITGEGILARKFISDLKKNNFIILNTPKKFDFIDNNKYIKIFLHRYIYPFIGLAFCWYNFFLNRNICYVNYLPLWNFFLFSLAPPKTLYGPITGGANFYKRNNLNFSIRKYLFPLFYRISIFFINCRKMQFIFSTQLLKKFIKNKIKNKILFNYALTLFDKKKVGKKKIDFLIYYREHSNKNIIFPYKFINKLSDHNIKVHIVGDKYKSDGVVNHGFIKRKKLLKLLSISRCTVASGENLYTIFSIDCINHKVNILVNTNSNPEIIFFKNIFLHNNFKVQKINFKKVKYLKKDLQEITYLKNSFRLFFKQL